MRFKNIFGLFHEGVKIWPLFVDDLKVLKLNRNNFLLNFNFQ